MLKKRNLVSIGIMILIVLATLWVVLKDGGAGQVWAAMAFAKWRWLALGCLLMGLYVGVEGLQIKIALGAMGLDAKYRHCCQYAASGFYFSSITPSSSGGQPAEVFYMARRGIPVAYGTLTMLLFTIFYQITVVFFGVGAWLFAPNAVLSLGVGWSVLLGYGLTVMVILTLGMVALLIWPRPMEGLCRWLLRLGHKFHIIKDLEKADEGLTHQMEEYAKGAEVIRTHPMLSVKLLLASALQQGLKFVIPWTVYMALGLSGHSLVEILCAQALVNLAVGCLPIPGAVGASEGAFLAAFHYIFTPYYTTSAMLLSRGISFYLPLVVTGVIVAVLHLQTRKNR